MFSIVDSQWKGIGKAMVFFRELVGKSEFVHSTQNGYFSYTQQLLVLYTDLFHKFLGSFNSVNLVVVHTIHRAYKYNYSYIQYN